MVEIIVTPLLEKIPIDIPLRDCLSYFCGNGNIIMWKLLIKTQKSSFFRNYTCKCSKILIVQLYITEIFLF